MGALYSALRRRDALYRHCPGCGQAHRSGKGAKYPRGRGPLTLCYREICPDHGTALRREYAVKQLTREEKELLIKSGSPLKQGADGLEK